MKDLKVYQDVLGTIGETPMIRLNKVVEDVPGVVYAKMENYNPGLSTKDRIALHILDRAESEGNIKPGGTVIETTSGNTGFSVAMVSRIRGYKCILAVSSKASRNKIEFMRSLGAEVHVCPANVPADDPRSYYQVATRLAHEVPNSIYINQYFNRLNNEAHYMTTGPEIWAQTQGKITHLIACSGTGGTLSGSGKFLKEKNPDIKIIGVDAYGSVLKKFHETGEFDESEIYPYRIEGLGKNLIPSTTDFDLIDHFEKVHDEPSALMTRQIALDEGIMVGYTSGAATQATLQLRNMFDENSVIVVIYPDHGARYMDKVFSDDWMKEQGFGTGVEAPVNGNHVVMNNGVKT